MKSPWNCQRCFQLWLFPNWENMLVEVHPRMWQYAYCWFGVIPWNKWICDFFCVLFNLRKIHWLKLFWLFLLYTPYYRAVGNPINLKPDLYYRHIDFALKTWVNTMRCHVHLNYEPANQKGTFDILEVIGNIYTFTWTMSQPTRRAFPIFWKSSDIYTCIYFLCLKSLTKIIRDVPQQITHLYTLWSINTPQGENVVSQQYVQPSVTSLYAGFEKDE